VASVLYGRPIYIAETPDMYYVLGCQLHFATRLVKDGTRRSVAQTGIQAGACLSQAAGRPDSQTD
jgi:hypothetical protein